MARDPLADRFDAVMARLGPWEPAPRLAVAVSGGADSSALTLLAADWVWALGGGLVGLIIDHGLRPESAAEAALTASRLSEHGIATRISRLTDLPAGPAVAARARLARYRTLERICAEAGIPHLLVGHHALDQAETVMIRTLGGSASSGLAAMPTVVEHRSVRILRPLLAETPAALRDFLGRRGVEWVEDPSNRDPKALRPRLRARIGQGPIADEAVKSLTVAAAAAGRQRCEAEQRAANGLARLVTLCPEGFAILASGPIEPMALAGLIRAIGGSDHAPSVADVADLARAPRPATLAGTRIVPAGRLGDGWLLVREERAMQGPVLATSGVRWDGRFRLRLGPDAPGDLIVGALGDDAAGFRDRRGLPTIVLRTLPALRRANMLAAVPQLHYLDPAFGLEAGFQFEPPRPAAGAPFEPCAVD